MERIVIIIVLFFHSITTGMKLYCSALKSINLLSRNFNSFASSSLRSQCKRNGHNRFTLRMINNESKTESMKVEVNNEAKIDYYSGVSSDGTIQFGDYSLIASQTHSDRSFHNIAELSQQPSEGSNSPKLGDAVWIRGRVTSVRAKGNVCFAVIRSGTFPFHTVQVCHFKDKTQPDESKKLIKFVGNLALESIVDIFGVLSAADVKSCTQSDVEVVIQKVLVVSRAPVQLPFLLEDAARSQLDIDRSQDSDRPFAGVSQDVRLNNRWLDLRVPANNAILRVRSGVCQLFRTALYNEGFMEINTPKLISGESEGGSEVFRTDYFGQPACLAQSPQLYKQMAISADFDRVFEIGPVFRAEKSFTRRHLCEFTGLDFEMAIKEHYNEALTVIHGLFRTIFDGLEQRYSKELAVIREQYPSEPVRFTDQPLIIHWPDAMNMLTEAGHTVDPFADLSTSLEATLGELVAAKYGADFFALDQYPSAVRPFYTMPNHIDARYSNSYDLFIRGQEICSGAQRCHDVDLLVQRVQEKGMDIGPLASYIESFRHGVPPHAGAGIGLDRVVFLYLGLDNVRKASMFPRDPNRITP
mmetsp:Transcript_19859/g.28397  ORF Transcript_19859/g.28397 Transcript_19859/m.28397 type:complete len:584 (-) Transcript_19859:2172-3923(-)